jgi:hypothetical protein
MVSTINTRIIIDVNQQTKFAAKIKPGTTMKKIFAAQRGENFNQQRRSLLTLVCLLMAGMIIPLANALPVQLLSARNPSVPLPAGGDGDSIVPVISPDGRYVVFSSEANDLVPGGNGRFALNIYLRDRIANTTVLISANTNGTGGGNGDSILGQVSANGRYVVFQSDASDFVPGDTNGVTDIFLRDTYTGITRLISAAADGSFANGASTDPVMTPDGTSVAFISAASNLVPGDTNGIPDVFVRDLITQTTWLVSVGATGTNATMDTPVMTSDGRYVAFASTATNLVSGVPATSQGEVYVRDRLAGTTTWASTNAAAIALTDLRLSGAPSYHPRLSDDGKYVTFKTGGTNTTNATVILQYTLAIGTTTVINTNGIGWNVVENDDYGPEMTPDGKYVAYVQHEGALNSGYSSVHVWDAQGGIDVLVSDPGSNGTIITTSQQPVLSADDSSVAFLSNTTNLLGNVVAGQSHIYLRNLTNSSLQLVDVDTNGIGSSDNQLAVINLSLNGRYVAFDSPDGSLVSGDNNHAFDVFVRDLFSNTTEMDSTRNATVILQTGDNFSGSQPSVSTNGQWVAFASAADDLVANDTNNLPDVFVRDLLVGTTTLVNAGSDGGPAWGGPSMNPVISADGRYVVFIGSATNLVAGQGVTLNANIFRRDLQTATTVLISVSTNGVDAANGDCSSPVVSQSGRYVAFLSAAGNLVPGVSSASAGFYRTFLRDINSGTTTALTNVPPGSFSLPTSIFPPSMSGDGRYAVYSSDSSGNQLQLRVWDDQLGMDVYTNGAGVSNAVLNATGTRVLYQSNLVTLVDDVMTGTNVFTFNYPVMMWGSGGFSADGRYVAFVAQTNIASGTNIYLCDMQTQAVTLVSANYTPILNNAGKADLPVISGDGRFVVYRSYAAGLVPGDINPVPNIYRYDRLLGTNSDLTTGQVGLSPVLWDSQPAVNGDGATIAFLSLGSGLVSVDLNRAPDAFAYASDVGMPLDSDGDGIPDWWMIQYFGHPTGQAGDLSLAPDDADGDGMSNLQEYLAGTDPANPQSVLRMTTVAVVKPGPELDVSWNSVSNKIYFLQRSSNLAALPASSILQSNIVGQAGTTTYQDTNVVDQGPYFYRVGVQQ